MSKALTLEADVNSANTITNMTTQGSVTAPSRVTPREATKISKILAAVGADSVAEGAANFLIRIGGDAVMNGEQTVVVASASTNTVQAGSDAPVCETGLFQLTDADIEIAGSEVIDVSAEMLGDDLGDSSVVVTLIFE